MPLPIIKSPVVVIGLKALNAAAAVVCPVPPLRIGTVPEIPDAGTEPHEGAPLVVAIRT